VLLLVSGLRAQDPASALGHARQVNLDRAAKLPNFVADEKAMRYSSSHADPPKWKYMDTFESELVVQGAHFQRQHVLRDGKPWNKDGFPHFNWSVEFGEELTSLFSAKCRNRIEFEGHQEFRGRQVAAYRFSAPQDGCFGTFTIGRGLFGILDRSKHFTPPAKGRFLVDEPEGNVLYFEAEAHEYPKGFGADTFKQTETWDYVKIGETSHLLPIAMELYAGFTRGDLWHAVVEYKNHRHFESATEVKFE
jgi:hypothetical protein